MKRISTILVALLAFGAISTANAIPLNFEFKGTVLSADDGNLFGLGVGDQIYGIAHVDGDETGFYTPENGLIVSFTVGSITFTTEQDFGFPFFPQLFVTNGTVDFLDFFAFDFGFNSFSTSFFPFWDAVDGFGLSLTGTLTATRIPEPGILSLYALGLLGFALVRRRVARVV